MIVRTKQFKKKSLQGQDLINEKVRERDNHTCQECGKKWKEGERRLDVHSKNKATRYQGISEMNNLVTMCHKCIYKYTDKMSGIRSARDKKRLANILLLKKEGWTLIRIAKRYGVTRQTISYLVKRYGDH